MFDIDLITIAISIVGIVAFIAPFYIKYRSNKKSSLISKKLLEDLIISRGLTIDKEDLWREQYYLGIDTKQGKLIYLDDINQFNPQIIDVSKINQVLIHEASHTLGDPKKSRKIIDSIYLQLQSSGNTKSYSLEIFDGDRFSDLFGEPVIAKKWKDLLTNEINKSKKAISEA